MIDLLAVILTKICSLSAKHQGGGSTLAGRSAGDDKSLSFEIAVRHDGCCNGLDAK